MHRAGVDGAFDHRLGLARAEIFLRVRHEICAAAGGAEVIGGALVVGLVLGRCRIDGHAADRIGRACDRWFGAPRREILPRIDEELGFAVVAAEIITLALVIGARLAGHGVNGHAADWVDDAAGGGRVVMVVLVPGGHAHGGHSWIVSLRWYPAALASNTPRGYIAPMRKHGKTATLKRLGRIEGQVRGLARMVEDERYCIDIVTQIAAVRAALRRVEEEILRDHVAHCVEHAIASGNKADQRRKVAEMMDVMGRAGR
jgi:DNA-binding FrmR family transcriptional regulator